MMNHSFDDRWKTMASAARKTNPAEPPEAPYGFATRVLARVREGERSSRTLLWQRFCYRTLGLVGAAFVMMIAFEFWQSSDSSPWRPTVEQNVEEQIFSLSS